MYRFVSVVCVDPHTPIAPLGALSRESAGGCCERREGCRLYRLAPSLEPFLPSLREGHRRPSKGDRCEERRTSAKASQRADVASLGARLCRQRCNSDKRLSFYARTRKGRNAQAADIAPQVRSCVELPWKHMLVGKCSACREMLRQVSKAHAGSLASIIPADRRAAPSSSPPRSQRTACVTEATTAPRGSDTGI